MKGIFPAIMKSAVKPFLALLCCGAAAFSFADAMTAKWQAHYDVYVKSITSRNFAVFKTYIAKDFVWVKPDGKRVLRDKALAEFKGIFDAKKVSGGEKVLKAVKRGAEVDVTYKASFTIVLADGTTSSFAEEGVDTWKQNKGKWQLVRSVDKPARKRISGAGIG